jgi:hypothetical protein
LLAAKPTADVPVGSAKLVEPDFSRGLDPRLWETLSELEIREGRLTRIDAP